MTSGKVEYDLFGNKIISIGGKPVEYNLFGDKIISVGGSPVSYDLFGNNITSIGGNRVNYDIFGNNITSIDGNEASYHYPITPTYTPVAHYGNEASYPITSTYTPVATNSTTQSSGNSGRLLIFIICIISLILLSKGFSQTNNPNPSVVNQAQTINTEDTQTNASSHPIVKHVQTIGLNLRTGPGIDNQVITELGRGQMVTLLGPQKLVDGSTWVEIQAGNYTGWVNRKHLR